MDKQYSITCQSTRSLYDDLVNLQQKGDFVDMILAADGHFVKVHQILFALASPYIAELIKTAQDKTSHPILFLNGISYKTLTLLLEYIYTGEVQLEIKEAKAFMDAGKKLHIKGIDNLEFQNPLIPAQSLNKKQYVETEEYIIDHSEYSQINQSAQEDCKNAEDQSIGIDNSEYSQINESAQEDCKNVGDQGIEEDTILDEVEIPDDMVVENTTDCRDILHNDPIKITKPYKIVQRILPKLLPKLPTTALLKRQELKFGEFKHTFGEMEYTVSNKGSLQMILNRYIYFEKYTKKDQMRQWRCVDYLTRLKCPASVISKGNKVTKRIAVHNHDFHDKRILKKIRAGTVYKTIDNVKCSPSTTQAKETS